MEQTEPNEEAEERSSGKGKSVKVSKAMVRSHGLSVANFTQKVDKEDGTSTISHCGTSNNEVNSCELTTGTVNWTMTF